MWKIVEATAIERPCQYRDRVLATIRSHCPIALNIMSNLPPDRRDTLQRLEVYLYLIPVFGVLPAWWTLYRTQANPAVKSASRLAVTLALIWLSGYILLGIGAKSSELPLLPLEIVNSVWTTTYFLINFGLMVRLWRRQPLWLPGLEKISKRLP
ncbi:MAG: hypothetical protein SWY16_13800 [Cyanobacteriota bacterium]|nr:hypothetical protein [Cyanobacteriota bacterium]